MLPDHLFFVCFALVAPFLSLLGFEGGEPGVADLTVEVEINFILLSFYDLEGSSSLIREVLDSLEDFVAIVAHLAFKGAKTVVTAEAHQLAVLLLGFAISFLDRV
jgi:hypothetical protein